MSMTNTKNKLKRADIEAKNGSETVRVPPECINLATDPNDELYCPDVLAEPSECLVESIASNGWADGSVIVCVDRGTKGGAPALVAVTGRSRRKAAIRANVIREARGDTPAWPEIKIIEQETAYALMLVENNKQKRGPLFEARRWEHHLRVTARRLGKTSLDVAERVKAREEFAALTKCSVVAVRRWEALLAAHPDVIAALEARRISANEVHRLIAAHGYDAQPAALAAMATTEAEAETEEATPEKADRPAKEKKLRGPKLRHPAILQGFIGELSKAHDEYMEQGNEEEAIELADALNVLRWAFGDDSALDGEANDELRRLAARGGWKKK